MVNYRSMGPEGVSIRFPPTSPLVIIGENNAGKSNLLKAIDLLFGDRWAGSHSPEDFEFFQRSPTDAEILIEASVGGVRCPKCGSDVAEIVYKYSRDATRPCEYYYKCHCDSPYVSKAVKDQLRCFTVLAGHDIAYQLSYASRYTALSKLMKSFHERLTSDLERMESIRTGHDNVRALFYDIPEFAKFASELKLSVQDFSGNMQFGLDVDFSAYDPSHLFRSLRLTPLLEGTPVSFDELGTGQGQMLAIAFAYAYAKVFGGSGLILAIDEPEAHLHPLAQDWLAVKLRHLAASEVQVV